MSLFGKKKTYNQALKDIKNNKISILRKKVRILLVDDEEYDIVELLKNRGYNIYDKRNIDYVEEVEPFDIIILDIKGIAQKFGSIKEGFGFAKEVKMIYPHKRVLCYSGTSDNDINEEVNKIDGYIKKDTDIDVWANRLDSNIEKYSSVKYHWNVIKEQLKDQGIEEKTIEDFENIYIKSFQTDSYDELKSAFMGNIKDAKLFIDVLESLISLVKVFV